VDYIVILEPSWEIIQDKHVGKGGASWKLYAHMQVRIIAPATHKPEHTFGETKAWTGVLVEAFSAKGALTLLCFNDLACLYIAGIRGALKLALEGGMSKQRHDLKVLLQKVWIQKNALEWMPHSSHGGCNVISLYFK
jgi:hypothetical protein